MPKTNQLVCSNQECESHKSDQYLFDTHVVVDGYRIVAENLNKIEAKHFECCFCHNLAVATTKEDGEKEEEEDRCPHGYFYSGAGACPQCG